MGGLIRVQVSLSNLFKVFPSFLFCALVQQQHYLHHHQAWAGC